MKKLFNYVTLSFLSLFIIFFLSTSLNIIGTQQKPEDALKFSSFQALFERIQDAKPNKSINQDDFETLREFVLLKSRNKDVPSRLREDWEVILNETNSDDIIKNIKD